MLISFAAPSFIMDNHINLWVAYILIVQSTIKQHRHMIAPTSVMPPSRHKKKAYTWTNITKS